jgi:hypothetical protein
VLVSSPNWLVLLLGFSLACGSSTPGGVPGSDGGGVARDGGTVTSDGGGVASDGGIAASDGGSAPADGGTAASDGGITPPGPTGAHPRLWIRAEDLDELRSWAVATNPLWEQGLRAALETAVQYTDAHWSWSFRGGTGTPDSGWRDTGSSNWEGDATEAYAEIFAFASLIHPDPAARQESAQRARDLLLYVVREAAKGAAVDQPFRDPAFSTYNRANYWGEAFGLTVDWIYGTLSADDKAVVRTAFLRWASECLTAATAGNEHPQPVGVVQSPELLADKKQLRWAANNYFTGHMRHLTLLSLALDPEDDPPVDPGQPANKLENSVRSYLDDVIGAWMYQQYAMYEDADAVAAAYGVPPDGLGLAAGGLSAEGFLYGHALGYLQEALYALYTAGYAVPSAETPQLALFTSSYWDRFVEGFLHSLAPASHVPDASTGMAYLGAVWEIASYGDILRFWIGPDAFSAFAVLGLFDRRTGNEARLAKSRWIAENVIEGGPAKLTDRAGQIWGNSYATDSILYFLLFDPKAGRAPDPRPSLPNTFYAPALGRVLARSDWGPNATWFTYKCTWTTINHQLGDCNQFELYRKGEWLTKERSGYAIDFILATSDYHNTLAIENDVPSDLAWFEGPTSERGGQWTNGMNAGDPTVTAGFGDDYVHAEADATNLYNRPNEWTPSANATDVVHASRSIVWLPPDHVVVYDRATTKTANRFKRFHLVTVGAPVVAGKRATVATPGGQVFYVQNVLPAGAVLTASPAEEVMTVAELDPTRYHLVVEDPAKPADVRFLHVLQGTDSGAAQDVPSLVQSSAGTAFDGVVVGDRAILFARDPSASFEGTTYAVPASVARQLVTGLRPMTGYTVMKTTSGPTTTITVSAGGTQQSDESGLLAF